KVPGISDTLAAQVVEAVQRVRKLDLKKSPSISETLDWAKTLTLLNAERLDEELVNDTLSAVLKYEGDIRKAQDELKAYLQPQRRRGAAEEGDEKDLLHWAQAPGRWTTRSSSSPRCSAPTACGFRWGSTSPPFAPWPSSASGTANRSRMRCAHRW